MDKIIVKTKQFGEISQNDKGEYLMTDAQKYEQLEKRGLENAKEVVKAVQKATEALSLDVYQFLGEKVKETKQDQFMSVGTGNNRIEYGVLTSKEINIPVKEGEAPRSETRYGYCTYKEQHKVPDAWKREDGPLAKMANEIEAVMKK